MDFFLFMLFVGGLYDWGIFCFWLCWNFRKENISEASAISYTQLLLGELQEVKYQYLVFVMTDVLKKKKRHNSM